MHGRKDSSAASAARASPEGRVLLTGIHALARVPIEQLRLDRTQELDTAAAAGALSQISETVVVNLRSWVTPMKGVGGQIRSLAGGQRRPRGSGQDSHSA